MPSLFLDPAVGWRCPSSSLTANGLYVPARCRSSRRARGDLCNGHHAPVHRGSSVRCPLRRALAVPDGLNESSRCRDPAGEGRSVDRHPRIPFDVVLVADACNTELACWTVAAEWTASTDDFTVVSAIHSADPAAEQQDCDLFCHYARHWQLEK